MADPLSIGTAVVGLLGAAAKLCTVLSTFIDSTANAPQSVAATLKTISEMNMALSLVQFLIESMDDLPSFPRSLIQVDDLSLILTDAVLTTSKLESLVCQKDGFRYRLQWAWKEKKVLSLLPRLESQKATLTFMVTVLQSTSNAEAERSSKRMREKIDEICEQNRTILQHFHLVDNERSLDARSVKFIDDATSVMSGRRSLRSLTSGAIASVRPHSIATSTRASLSMRGFETALQSSRVYKRSKSNQSDISFTTSNAPTNTWSSLSGISLEQVSIISTFHLPITLNDIHAIAPGSTFSAMFKDSAEMDTESTPRRDGTGRMWSTRRTALWNRQLEYINRRSVDVPADVIAIRESGSSVHLPKVRVIVLGDSNALKSKMIHTFIQGNAATGRDHVFQSSDCFRSSVRVSDICVGLELQDTTGLEEYPFLRQRIPLVADAFLVLSSKREDPSFESVRECWIPEICSSSTNIPYFIVGTQDDSQEEARNEYVAISAFRVEPSTEGRKVAKQTGAARYVDCDVGDVASVSGLIGQIIREAMFARSLRV